MLFTLLHNSVSVIQMPVTLLYNSLSGICMTLTLFYWEDALWAPQWQNWSVIDSTSGGGHVINVVCSYTIRSGCYAAFLLAPAVGLGVWAFGSHTQLCHWALWTIFLREKKIFIFIFSQTATSGMGQYVAMCVNFVSCFLSCLHFFWNLPFCSQLGWSANGLVFSDHQWQQIMWDSLTQVVFSLSVHW